MDINPYKTTNASIIKAILQQKRCSKFRISNNRKWNEHEDRCYISVTHFNKLNFGNENNDAIVLSQLKKMVYIKLILVEQTAYILVRQKNHKNKRIWLLQQHHLVAQCHLVLIQIQLFYMHHHRLSQMFYQLHLLPLVVTQMYLPSKIVLLLNQFLFLMIGHYAYITFCYEYNVLYSKPYYIAHPAWVV